MTDHTCSHHCDLPACIKQQRDQLVANLARSVADQAAIQIDREDVHKLGLFAVRMLTMAVENEIDGVIDVAADCGLLVQTEMSVPCGPECLCAESAQLGETVDCCRVQPVMLRALERDDFDGEFND